MSAELTESVVDGTALVGLESLGGFIRHDLDISPGESKSERTIGRIC